MNLTDKILEAFKKDYPGALDDPIEASDYEIYESGYLSALEGEMSPKECYEVCIGEDSDGGYQSMFFTTNKEKAEKWVDKANKLIPKLQEHYAKGLPLNHIGIINTTGSPEYNDLPHNQEQYYKWITVRDLTVAYIRTIILQ